MQWKTRDDILINYSTVASGMVLDPSEFLYLLYLETECNGQLYPATINGSQLQPGTLQPSAVWTLQYWYFLTRKTQNKIRQHSMLTPRSDKSFFSFYSLSLTSDIKGTLLSTSRKVHAICLFLNHFILFSTQFTQTLWNGLHYWPPWITQQMERASSILANPEDLMIRTNSWDICDCEMNSIHDLLHRAAILEGWHF